MLGSRGTTQTLISFYKITESFVYFNNQLKYLYMPTIRGINKLALLQKCEFPIAPLHPLSELHFIHRYSSTVVSFFVFAGSCVSVIDSLHVFP